MWTPKPHVSAYSSLAMTAVLAVRDLKVMFPTLEGPVSAVRGVNLTLEPGRVLGVVGESGRARR